MTPCEAALFPGSCKSAVNRLCDIRNMDVRVKVIPKSSKTELAGYLPDGTWKVKIAAAPERGKANRALCDFIAEKLGVAKSKVRIVAGGKSRGKRGQVDI